MTNLTDVTKSDAYKGKFLKGQYLSGRPTAYTISDVTWGEMDGQGERLLLSFDECQEQLVCNKTQFETLLDLYGPDATKWPGKRIDLMSRKLTAGQFAGRFTIDVLAPEAPDADDGAPFDTGKKDGKK